MKTVPRWLLCTLLFVLAGFLLPETLQAQQPTIAAGGIVNGASYALNGMPNAGIAQGAIFIVFGTNLGPASLVQASSFPLPTAAGLAGTSVRVTVGATSVDAIMLYTSATQVAAVLPSNTPVGTGTVTVTYNGRASATAPITVVRSSLGIFAVNQGGSGPGVIQNVNSETSRPVNAVSEPVRPGQVMILWGTGIGPVSGNEAAGPLPGDLTNINVRVWVGGREAEIRYRGRSGCCVGVDQIVFVVPPGVEGCYVPVAVQIDNVISNYVSVAVAGSGNTCSDPTGFTAAEISGAISRNSMRICALNLTRLSLSFSEPGLPPIEFKTDTGGAVCMNYNAAQLQQSQGICVPPAVGTCMVRTFRAGSEASDPVTGTPLNAGPVINVTGPRGAKQMTPQAQMPGFYLGMFSSPSPLGGADYLEAGNYAINNGNGASGTNTVGPFQVNYVLPSPLVWSNQAAITAVNRAQGVQVTWTGGSPDAFIGIYGSSTNAANTAGASFVCFARASAGSFTVPPSVLLALPPSGTSTEGAGSFLAIGNINPPARFNATGLDIGIVNSTVQSGKTVSYQ